PSTRRPSGPNPYCPRPIRSPSPPSESFRPPSPSASGPSASTASSGGRSGSASTGPGGGCERLGPPQGGRGPRPPPTQGRQGRGVRLFPNPGGGSAAPCLGSFRDGEGDFFW